MIYPAIGIARVGSSDAYFYGPEVVDPLPLPPGSYRDDDKKLKRQAARSASTAATRAARSCAS
ncbi:MAG: LodA/GoxA family CTQ-dependent oxidase [Sphingomonas sp.]